MNVYSGNAAGSNDGYVLQVKGGTSARTAPGIHMEGGTGGDNSSIHALYNLRLGCNSGNSISGREIQFTNGDTNLGAFNSNGNFEIDNGNVVIQTSGKGIDFSATGDGNGTDTSSVFDDYEEGTWTPNFAGSSSNPSFTWISGFPRGYYTKNGQMVTVNFDMAWSGVTAGTGNLQLTGLPYSTIGNFYSGFGIVSHGTGLETASQGPRGIYSNAQVTFLYIVKNASSNVVVSATTLQANGHVFGGFTYRAHE
jgi:hypothetical protein